jgi:hypothetical protein
MKNKDNKDNGGAGGVWENRQIINVLYVCRL